MECRPGGTEKHVLGWHFYSLSSGGGAGRVCHLELWRIVHGKITPEDQLLYQLLPCIGWLSFVSTEAPPPLLDPNGVPPSIQVVAGIMKTIHLLIHERFCLIGDSMVIVGLAALYAAEWLYMSLV